MLSSPSIQLPIEQLQVLSEDLLIHAFLEVQEKSYLFMQKDGIRKKKRIVAIINHTVELQESLYVKRLCVLFNHSLAYETEMKLPSKKGANSVSEINLYKQSQGWRKHEASRHEKYNEFNNMVDDSHKLFQKEYQLSGVIYSSGLASIRLSEPQTLPKRIPAFWPHLH